MADPGSGSPAFAEFTLADGRHLWVGPVAAYIKEGAGEPSPQIYIPACMVELPQARSIEVDGEPAFRITKELISLPDALIQAGSDAPAVLQAAREVLPLAEARASELGIDAAWWQQLCNRFREEIGRGQIWLGRQAGGQELAG